jgi:hypothetical protein
MPFAVRDSLLLAAVLFSWLAILLGKSLTYPGRDRTKAQGCAARALCLVVRQPQVATAAAKCAWSQRTCRDLVVKKPFYGQPKGTVGKW